MVGASFTAIIEPDEGGFHAYIPALPGCHTFGDTVEEARTNLLEAAERKIDGLQADVKAISTTALGAQAGKEALAAVQQFQQNSAQGTAKPTR
jgi:predicted RNase H-like HicB family nuclease